MEKAAEEESAAPDREQVLIASFIRDRIRYESFTAERIIAVIQCVFVLFYAILYNVAPKPSDLLEAVSLYTILFAVLVPLSLLRLGLSFKNTLYERITWVFIFFDILTITAMIAIIPAHYNQQASFYLKAPTFIYYFFFIGIRALQYDLRSIVLAGALSVVSWIILTGFAVREGGMLTHSFGDYMLSNQVLLGAEVEKITCYLLGEKAVIRDIAIPSVDDIVSIPPGVRKL